MRRYVVTPFAAIIGFVAMILSSCGGSGGGGATPVPDTTPPTVSATDPPDGARGAALNGAITATFSETMDAATITPASFLLRSAGGAVNGSVSYSGRTARFTPTSPLTPSTSYIATITTAARDVAGNAVAADFTWDFISATDAWQVTPVTPSTPAGRIGHTAVWTGSEMIVWGGETSSGIVNTGGRFNPSSSPGSWTATTLTGAPAVRAEHTAVWTGSEMIVWGGNLNLFIEGGGRYQPSVDTWRDVTPTNAPSPRNDHTAVWTGSEMIVWGGNDGTGLANTGGRYVP